MNNYKIRVENGPESREAQELFFELGFEWIGEKAGEFWETTTSWIYAKDHNKALYGGSVCTDTVYKQITLPELRDLVVLKRNDARDATHTCNGCKYYLTLSEFFEYINDHWENVDGYVDGCSFEPIEKPVKEYLDPRNGYKLIEAPEALAQHASEWILVPEGADVALSGGGGSFYFYKNNDSYFNGLEWRKCDVDSIKTVSAYVDTGAAILWQRYKQPKELPFIDDEPTLDKIKIKVDGDLNKAIDIAKCEGYYNCQFDKIPHDAYWLLCNEDGTVDYSMNENIINEYAFLHTDRSLNDQYAEIEKIRQVSTETECLMRVKNGEKLIESLAQFNNTDHGADFDNLELLEDNVNHPSHYTNGKVECIDALESATVGKKGIEAVCVANVIKYLWRYEDKNGIEDIKKAKWYLEKLINTLE